MTTLLLLLLQISFTSPIIYSQTLLLVDGDSIDYKRIENVPSYLIEVHGDKKNIISKFDQFCLEVKKGKIMCSSVSDLYSIVENNGWEKK